MEINLAVVADSANVSVEGKLNISGIFDTFYAQKLPVALPTFVLVVRLDAHSSEMGDHEIKVRLVDEDGEAIATLVGKGKMEKSGKAVSPTITGQLILPFGNLTLPAEGTYSFDILLDGRFERSVPLRVVLTK